MSDDFVTVEYPSGTVHRIRCVPAGKRRFALWHGHQFLGHAIARIDGTWSGKSPDQQTHPGCEDRDSALRALLELRARVAGLLREMGQGT